MILKQSFTLDTPRLHIRRVQQQDVGALLDVNGDDETTRYLPYRTWRDAADGEAWFERMTAFQANGDAAQMVIMLKESDRPIGTCLLFAYDEPSSRMEIGYVLGRQYWAQGYMSEAMAAVVAWAFGSVALRRLEATIDPRNLASAVLLDRLGFAFEGTRRQRSLIKGSLVDTSMYGLLREDWVRMSRPSMAGRP